VNQSGQEVTEEIEEELANDEELRDLPRRRRPETLRSIFDQPLPVIESKKTIDLLKSPSLLSNARAEKRARIERLEKTQESVSGFSGES